MDVTKPYDFMGFGAMDVTKPYDFIGFGAMDVNFKLRPQRRHGMPMPTLVGVRD